MTIKIKITFVNMNRIMNGISHLEDLCQITLKIYLIGKKTICLPTRKFLYRSNVDRYSVLLNLDYWYL